MLKRGFLQNISMALKRISFLAEIGKLIVSFRNQGTLILIALVAVAFSYSASAV
jgi:hypothetical protein